MRRTIQRDYPEETRNAARELFRQYGNVPHDNEPTRVKIDCIQFADGSIGELAKAVQAAKADSRDIILEVEYAGIATQNPNGDFTMEAEAATIKEDWRQFRAWLKRK